MSKEDKYLVSANHYCLPVDCCGKMMVRDTNVGDAAVRAMKILRDHLGADFTYRIIGVAEKVCESGIKYHLRIALLGNLYVRAENLKDAWRIAEEVVGDVLSNVQWSIENWEDR